MANLKKLAAQIEQHTQHKLARSTILLPLPIYDEQYAAEFGILADDKMDGLENLPPDTPRVEQHQIAAQFIWDACRQIHAQGDESWEPLEHDDGRPVLFDLDLAQTLDLPAPNGNGWDAAAGADVVLACFKTDDGKLASPALQGFALRLVTWMQDTRRPVEDEVVLGWRGSPK